MSKNETTKITESKINIFAIRDLKDTVIGIVYKVVNIEFNKNIGFFINNTEMFRFATDSGGGKLGTQNTILEKYKPALNFFVGLGANVSEKATFSKLEIIVQMSLEDEFSNRYIFDLRYV